MTPSTLKKWLSGTSKMPFAALTLARARFGGQLEHALGKAWQECTMDSSRIYLPGCKYPFELAELRRTWITIQEAYRIQSRIRTMQDELNKARAETTYFRMLSHIAFAVPATRGTPLDP